MARVFKHLRGPRQPLRHAISERVVERTGRILEREQVDLVSGERNSLVELCRYARNV